MFRRKRIGRSRAIYLKSHVRQADLRDIDIAGIDKKWISEIESKVIDSKEDSSKLLLFRAVSKRDEQRLSLFLAHGLSSDLYRIDSTKMVGRYIGETEKNLKAILEKARRSGGTLFFDEADAIFGKRTGMMRRRNRYANMEVSHLFEIMQRYNVPVIFSSHKSWGKNEGLVRDMDLVLRADIAKKVGDDEV